MSSLLAIVQLSDILKSLHKPVDQIIESALSTEDRAEIVNRGYFRPSEDEALAAWLAKLLSVRNELWGIIYSVNQHAGVPLRKIRTLDQWRCFVLGYTAACLLVRLDRFFLWDFATHKSIQRKLNEAFPVYRIPPKSFTTLFQHYTDFSLAFRLYQAIWFARLRSRKISKLKNDEIVGRFAENRKHYERYLDNSKRRYLRNSSRLIRHKSRRRLASAKQKTMFAVVEQIGKSASEIRIDRPKQINASNIDQFRELLRPGDILVTRHLYALTNLFLPGYWPHASLYVGTEEQREQLGIDINQDIRSKWIEDICTLEALKDGVKLRPLSESLNVDACVVLRPKLSDSAISAGISRIVRHEGKGYNFDFDFFRSDRLVCTEIIYRAFDGIDGFEFELTDRAGRKSLSAEDILDKALRFDGLEVVALFGYPVNSDKLVVGNEATDLLAKSYCSDATEGYCMSGTK